MPDKFRVQVTKGLWQDKWPDYFDNFYRHCQDYAAKHNFQVLDTVIDYQLKPFGGKLIKTKTQGWYLRWDQEASHTFFVLKWS